MNTTLDEDESSLNSEPWMDPDISKQNAGRAIRPPSCSFMLIESREWWRAMLDERRVIKELSKSYQGVSQNHISQDDREDDIC